EIEGDDDNELEEDDPPSAELRFVPDDKSALNDIYAAICDCQVLHPDEQEQLEDEMAGKMFGTQHEANWKSKILQFSKKYLFIKTNDVIVGHTVFRTKTWLLKIGV
ncbi:Hypothetical predicted protein, partial [Paramuricea clavata]